MLCLFSLIELGKDLVRAIGKELFGKLLASGIGFFQRGGTAHSVWLRRYG